MILNNAVFILVGAQPLSIKAALVAIELEGLGGVIRGAVYLLDAVYLSH